MFILKDFIFKLPSYVYTPILRFLSQNNLTFSSKEVEIMNPLYSKALKMGDYMVKNKFDHEGKPFPDYKQLHGIANFAVIFENGDVDMFVDAACHAAISQRKVPNRERDDDGLALNCYTYKKNIDEDKRTHVVTCLQPDVEDEKYLITCHKFIDWLLNRSPFSSVFITKSSDIAMRKRRVVLSAKHPTNLLQAGLIASRTIKEWPYKLNMWYELTERGVEESLAFAISHPFQMDATKVFIDTGFCGHCVFDSDSHTVGTIKNFTENKPVHLTENYEVNRNYQGVHALFTPENTVKYADATYQYWKKVTIKVLGDKFKPSQWCKKGGSFNKEHLDLFVNEVIPLIEKDIANA